MNKPWYKKPGFIAGICLITLAAIVLGLFYNREQATSQTATAQVPLAPAAQTAQANEEAISHSPVYQEPTDSSAQDQQDESTIDFSRLKAFIKKIKDRAIDTTQLDAQINQIIADNPDISFSVSIDYLNTGQTHRYGISEAMTAASVTKVLTAVDYYKEVELGHKRLDTVMYNGQTAQKNIEQMIVVSDNTAWHVLNESLTYQQLQNYAHSIGLSSYNSQNNTISSNDVNKLLADMYQRQLINETNTQQLLGYMERANYRDLVIPAVPETDTVYHKAGEYNGYLHDATIITNTTNTVVLTIFTRSLKGYSKSRVATLMQQIATPTLQTFHLN